MDGRTTAKELSALRGLRVWSEGEGRRAVAAWEASGESVGVFARRAGIVPQRISWWKKRLGCEGERQRPFTTAPSLVPVTVRSQAIGMTSAALTVVATDGLRIEVAELDATSAAWVATLVKTLREVRS